jgi:hypothetical protein
MQKLKDFKIEFLLILGIVAFLSNACVKDEDPDANGNSNGSEQLLGSAGTTFNCGDFAYSDTLIHINIENENLLPPTKKLSGTFEAVPEGLVLDSLTGEIDVNKSESGLKYKITFRPTNGAPECTTFLTISGVNYLDAIYVLEENQRYAIPIFNGDPLASTPCEDDDEDDDIDDDDCEFDVEGPDGTKLEDFGVSIDDDSGEIDLQETIEAGALGANPSNGDFEDFKMYYRLADNSGSALNSIDIRIYYFETTADIPQSLLDEMTEKNEQILNLPFQNPFSDYARVMADNPKAKPRPPYLLVVARR